MVSHSKTLQRIMSFNGRDSINSQANGKNIRQTWWNTTESNTISNSKTKTNPCYMWTKETKLCFCLLLCAMWRLSPKISLEMPGKWEICNSIRSVVPMKDTIGYLYCWVKSLWMKFLMNGDSKLLTIWLKSRLKSFIQLKYWTTETTQCHLNLTWMDKSNIPNQSRWGKIDGLWFIVLSIFNSLPLVMKCFRKLKVDLAFMLKNLSGLNSKRVWTDNHMEKATLKLFRLICIHKRP